MNPGKLIYLIGASGSGKDSILRHIAAKEHAHIYVCKRYITRPASDDDNDHSYLSNDEFARRDSEAFFSMTWQANGFYYGVEQRINALLRDGTHVLINGSREYASNVRKNFPHALIVLVRVDDEVWQRRLKHRKRETTQQINARIKRHQNLANQSIIYDACIDNDADIEDAAQSLLTILAEKS